ncbi:uncharacterized protein [Littorina saxatilis]|uniref:Thromboxane A2 receptor n=1 Tax=Littorina saxatilis TaxID=31220 RepID=A0AAN9B869_9CAEN
MTTFDPLLTTAEMTLMSNLTPRMPVCSMASLNKNVTDSSGSVTGASIASPIVMFLAGIVGNVLALVVLHRTKTEIRSMMFYTLVAALTWNDLVGILLTSPVPLATYINNRQMPAVDKLCRFHAFIMVCFGLSTPLIVCTMAIERSLALKCTYFYSKYCTPSSARILVVALWAFVLVFGALPLFGVGSYSLQYPCTWCFLDFRSIQPLDMSYAYVYAILNLVVVVVMIFCNALVMTTLCRVRKSRRKLSNASLNSTLLNYYADAVEEKARAPRRRPQRDVELQMIWLVCAITTIFSVCWVPLMAYILFCLHSPQNHNPVFGLVAVRLASLNQTLNPWIYVILRKSLLARIRRLCCTCLDDPDTLQIPRRRAPPNYPNPYRQGQGQGQGQPKGRHHNYVHVGHQLCPSSQFVGQKNDAASLSEGHRKSKSGSSVRSKSRDGNSRSGGSKNKGSFLSESWTDGDRGRRGGGGGSCSMCSVCKARLMRGEDDLHSYRSFTSSSSQPSCGRGDSCSRFMASSCVRDQSCDRITSSAACSAACDDPSEDPCQPFLMEDSRQFNEPMDGIYVDLFRQIPSPEAPPPSDDVKGYVIKMTCRSQAERGGGAGVEAAVNANSSISEADDHGYASRVSTDSSSQTSSDEHRRTRLKQQSQNGASALNVHSEKSSLKPNKTSSSSSTKEKSDGRKSSSSVSSETRNNPQAQKDLAGDDSMDLSSGVFHSRDDGFEVSTESNDVKEEEVSTNGQKDESKSRGSRSVSCSSSGTHTDPSSGHDRTTVKTRQLSTSSGH